MKGLFYKEARCLWQYGKSYILMVVVFFGLSMVNDGGINTMWLLYPVFLLASLPASLLNADEKDGWMMYCDILPVTRRPAGHRGGPGAGTAGPRLPRRAENAAAPDASDGADRAGADVPGHVQAGRHQGADGV